MEINVNTDTLRLEALKRFETFKAEARKPEAVKTALALTAVVIAFVAWTRSTATIARQELQNVPGAAVTREGMSQHPDLFDEALRLMERRNFVGAESVYREVLAHEPNSAQAYIGLGTTRFQQKDLDGAQRNVRRALDLDPESSGAALGLGSVAYRQAQYAAAVKYYKKALAVKGTTAADAHWGLGLAYDAMGKTAEARKHYNEFLRLAPDSGQAPVARTRLNFLSQSH